MRNNKGQFIKGTSNWKGKKHSEESKKKISLNHANVKGVNNPMFGKKRPQYIKDALSRAHLGKKLTEEHKSKLGRSWIGRKHTKEERMKMSLSQKGDKSPHWKGGITSLIRQIRHSLEYKLWREAVFERDNYTCIWCRARNGNGYTVYLEADHIKAFSLYPELRFAIDNGRTLCKKCHKTTKNYGKRL